MQQPQQPIINGPNSNLDNKNDNVATSHKDVTLRTSAPQPQNGSNPPPKNEQTPPVTSTNPVRPPLQRIDSRQGFPYRSPFTNSGPTNPAGIRPAIRPNNPDFRPPAPNQGQDFRPPQRPVRPFQTQQSFPAPNQGANPALAQQGQRFRPPGPPFPRPPIQRPPAVFSQRSVPNYPTVRPQLSSEEDSLVRSQTVDGSDTNLLMRNNRRFSIGSNNSDSEKMMDESRRQSIENTTVEENSNHSRPESRANSRMNKIMEDEDSKSSLTDVTTKSISSLKISSDLDNSNGTTKSSDFSNKLSMNNNSFSESETKGKENKVNDSNSHIIEPKSNPINQEKSKPPIAPVADPIKEAKPDGRKLLDLNYKETKSKSPARSEGDNDSGVDESTQGNEINGDGRTPRKTSKSRTSSATPTKGSRSLSRNSKSPSLKCPDSTATTPGSATERKKLPMNKIQVGSAPSPNLKVVKSKIGSLENASYKPGGGKVKIENKKIEIKATPRIEAKNDKYTPKGGDKKIVQQKLQWNAKSKIGSLENASYKPKGGDKKIESIKLDFKEKAASKVGSKDNIKHVPGGGDVKSEEKVEISKVEPKEIKKDIETKKIELNVTSKVGSLNNVKHKPGGGDKKIFDDKDYIKQRSSNISSQNQSLSGSQHSLPSQPDTNHKGPVADENLNREH